MAFTPSVAPAPSLGPGDSSGNPSDLSHHTAQEATPGQTESLPSIEEPSSDETSDEPAPTKMPHVPVEIWLKVINRLPSKELKTARLVNHAWNDFVS
jgi:hypothetical protein